MFDLMYVRKSCNPIILLIKISPSLTIQSQRCELDRSSIPRFSAALMLKCGDLILSVTMSDCKSDAGLEGVQPLYWMIHRNPTPLFAYVGGVYLKRVR